MNLCLSSDIPCRHQKLVRKTFWMPITQVPQCQFSFQINWVLQHMIKIHNSDEGATSLLKISLSEHDKKNKKTRSPVSGEK
jgi:hypothetical protein